MCKRPCSNDEYLPTFNRPNVTLVDVSESKGVERLTENGVIANGIEYEVDCVIFASGFEITTDISRRYAIDVIEGRDGLSLFDHWRDSYKITARDDQPRLPQPVLHRFRPGWRGRQHHRDARAAGRTHRLHHFRSDERGARPPSNRARKLKTPGSGRSVKPPIDALGIRRLLHARLLQQRGRRWRRGYPLGLGDPVLCPASTCSTTCSRNGGQTAT